MGKEPGVERDMALSETIIVRVLLAERAKLLAYIWVIVRDAHLVEDVFQEVAALAVQKRRNCATRRLCRSG